MITTIADLQRKFKQDTGLDYSKFDYDLMEHVVSPEYVPWIEEHLLWFINQDINFINRQIKEKQHYEKTI